MRNAYAWALLAGLSWMSGFAPFGIYLIPDLALVVLFVCWQRAATPRVAARLGFVFGCGLFGTGISWIYIALHDYGYMPMWLALPATMLFCGFLGLFTALAGYVQARLPARNRLRTILVMPAVWALIEWLRGMIFTGFPWLALGYAHGDSPLAGYAPLLGVYGVSLMGALSAGLAAQLWVNLSPGPAGQPEKPPSALAWGNALIVSGLILLWGVGVLLRTVNWTTPYGTPFSVALVQGNIEQGVKFDEDMLADTLTSYRRLVLQGNAQLTVLPETAFPMVRNDVPQSLIGQLRDHAVQNGGDVLVGAFDHDEKGYYNSVFSVGMDREQHYHKQHLVPFGEFIPLRPLLGWLINGALDIPMGDLARGGKFQPPLDVAGQRVAVNICYEDVFGEEIIRALPNATLLVNVTNDAWYGHSDAAAQHNQISRMRALETGRMMLRATNTGVTSIIGPRGNLLQRLPQHREGVLQGTAQGYAGSTPYVRWGNTAVLLLIVALMALPSMQGVGTARSKR